MVTRVIFIVGMERSGSTLVHNLIGQYDDVAAFGEVKYVYKNFDRKMCGCGHLVKECRLWRKVITNNSSKYFKSEEPMITKSRFFFLYLNKYIRRKIVKKNNEYVQHVKNTYRKLAEASESCYILDSSKNLIQPLLLIDDHEFDVKIIHVTRDPRGVEYSLFKRKLTGHKDNLNHSPLLFCFKWCIANRICLSYKKMIKDNYIFIRYEDIMQRADSVLNRVAIWLDIEKTVSVQGNKIELDHCHSAGGSPSRLKTGEINLKPDIQWQKELPPKITKLVTVMTKFCRKSFEY